MSLTGLGYDACSFKQSLNDTMAPGIYVLGTPLPVRERCDGPDGTRTDTGSELLGLRRTESKCADKHYRGEGPGGLHCPPPAPVASRLVHLRSEGTRVSNPPSTMRGSGINRWTPLCEEPQKNAIKPFEHIPYNDKRRAKDGYGAAGCAKVPIGPLDASGILPRTGDCQETDSVVPEPVADFVEVPMLPEYYTGCESRSGVQASDWKKYFSNGGV